MRKHDQQGTSHEENVDMIVEWVRAHAWGASWIIVCLIAGYVFAIVDWIITGDFL